MVRSAATTAALALALTLVPAALSELKGKAAGGGSPKSRPHVVFALVDVRIKSRSRATPAVPRVRPFQPEPEVQHSTAAPSDTCLIVLLLAWAGLGQLRRRVPAEGPGPRPAADDADPRRPRRGRR